MRYVNSLFDFFVIFDNEKSRKLACKGLRLRTLSVNHNNVIEQIADKLIESQNDRLNDTSVRAVLNKQKVQLEKQIDFDNPGNNIFKVVNQVEIQGKSELRIPDAIVYINGLPLVVIEFKSATRENATIYNAYEQLTVRYTRDIPDLFKYNAFVVISDGANNKYGSIFADYDYFYAWRKIDDGESEVDGINSLYSLVKGLFRKERLKVNIILKLAEYNYPPVTQDEVYKEVLEQAENFRKYANN